MGFNCEDGTFHLSTLKRDSPAITKSTMSTELHTAHFKKILSEFEQALLREGKSENYTESYARNVSEFLCFMEGCEVYQVTGITQKLADGFILYLETERMNRNNSGLIDENTVARIKVSIRIFWKYLLCEGYKVFPIRLIHKRKKKFEIPEVLTAEEVAQLFLVCDDSAIGYRDRCMLALYYGCGMRKSEGLRLLVSDIDFSRGRIHIRKSKNNRERYVVMSPAVQQMVEQYVYQYRDMYLPEGSRYEEIFIGERGRPVKPETLVKRMDELMLRMKDRYGVEKNIGIHGLRHSLGTHLYMAGMSLEMVALMLGHVTLEATQRYVHIANLLKK
jgi:integrase/recombinase XerD